MPHLDLFLTGKPPMAGVEPNVPSPRASLLIVHGAALTAALAGCGSSSSPADQDDTGDGGIASLTQGTGTTAETSTDADATTQATATGGSTSSADSSGSGNETSASTTGQATGDGSSGNDAESSTGGCGGDGPTVVDFSYIWIANTTQGTVSKIDTATATEVGRYLVGDYEGQAIDTCLGPSRTSVNLDGDVAVLDRTGGLTKVIADPDLCPDLDGDLAIETAVDENYLPWGDDECVAWRIDVPNTHDGCDGPRAVQWAAPEAIDECTLDDPRLWVAFCNADDTDVTVWLVNGVDGTVEVEVPVEGYGCATWGPYGGVVDANNDFWFVDRNSGQELYRVEYGCTPMNPGDCWESFTPPPGEDAYGITIDALGRIWMAGSSNSLYAFDPATQTFTSLQPELDAYFAEIAGASANADNTLRGVMSDTDDVLWIATIQASAWGGGANPGLLRVDPNADPIEIDFYGPDVLVGIEHAAGISIDVDGYVWLVDTLGDQAFRIDPAAPQNHVVVGGLQYPYTYSDMTGFALEQIVPG